MRVAVFVLLVVMSGAAGSGVVDYSDQEGWGDFCNNPDSIKQSPVDVVVPETSTTVEGNLVLLSDGADRTGASNLNDPSTIKIKFSQNITYMIPGLEDTKGKVLQLHLHWGANDETGSEHLLGSKQFSAEAHLVTSYGEDGKYAVLARFFQIGEENEQINKMITSAESESEDDRNINDFNLRTLYPDEIKEVITYEGSLTTPGCDEVVHWVIVPQPLSISSDQLESLRVVKLGDGNGDAKTYNWRNKQELNGRNFSCIKSAALLPFQPKVLIIVTFLNLIIFGCA